MVNRVKKYLMERNRFSERDASKLILQYKQIIKDGWCNMKNAPTIADEIAEAYALELQWMQPAAT